MTVEQRPRLTDSPLFWVYVFSTAAVAALFLMDGKYRHRQNDIEDKYRFGTRTLSPPAGESVGRPDKVESAERMDDVLPLTSGPQPQTHELLISLTPLRIIAIATMIISWIALQWRRVREASGERPEASSR